MADAPIDVLILEIDTQASEASEDVNKLTNSLRALGGVRSAEALEEIRNELYSLHEEISGVSGELSLTTNYLRDIGSATAEAARGTQVTNEYWRGLEQTLVGFNEELQTNIRGLTREARATSEGRRSMRDYASAVHGAVREHTNFTGAIKSAFSGLTGLFNRIRRVIGYRMIRSAIREVTEGIRTGITNLYQFSQLTGGSFSQSMDKASSQLLYMKNAIATALAPAIEALIPILVRVTDFIAAVADKIAEFFAAWRGDSVYTSAKKITTTWEDGAKSLDKAAKATKYLISGFDELNVYSRNNSGSGDSSALDVSEMFEDKEVNQNIKNITDKLQSFFGKMRKYAEGIKEAFAPIWEKLGRFVTETIPSLWNSISPLLAEVNEWAMTSVFPKVLNIINAALETINALLTPLKKGFDDLVRITAPIREWLKEKVAIILDHIRTSFEQLTAGFQKKAPQIQGILGDLGAILHDIYLLVRPIIDELLTPENLNFLSEVSAELLMDSISLLADVVKWLRGVFDILSGLANGDLDKVLGGIERVVKGFFGAIGDMAAMAWNGIVAGFEGNIRIVTSLVKSGITYMKNFVSGILDSIDNFGSTIKRHAIGFINDIIGGVEWALNLITAGVNKIISALNTKITLPDFLGGGEFSLGIPELTLISLGRIPTDTSKSGGGTGGFASQYAGFYADGGIVSGDLFFARENGSPEYVGSFGNQTAVANNDQIVEGIAGGVATALSAYVPAIIGAIEENRTEVNIGDDQIARSASNGNFAFRKRTGKSLPGLA